MKKYMKTIDSLVKIDGVLYPIYKEDGELWLRYADIKPHPVPRLDDLLAAFDGHQVVRHKATPETTESYKAVVARFTEEREG